jgi:hypothetical protein
MSEVADSPYWRALGMVLDQNTRDFLAGRYGVTQDIVAWLKAVDLFRAAEDEHLVLRDPTLNDLRQHRTWLASLVAEGQRLLTESLAQGGLPPGIVPFRLADVEATIENLRSDERMWHGRTVTQERKKEILKALSDVPKPRA